MSNPLFLSHTLLDAPTTLLALTPDEAAGRATLCRLRDDALARGAVVLLVMWSQGVTLLAVELPPGTDAPADPMDVVPQLLGNPEALAQMQAQAAEGKLATWLTLQRNPAALH